MINVETSSSPLQMTFPFNVLHVNLQLCTRLVHSIPVLSSNTQLTGMISSRTSQSFEVTEDDNFDSEQFKILFNRSADTTDGNFFRYIAEWTLFKLNDF